MSRKSYAATVTGNVIQKSKEKQTPSINIKVRLDFNIDDPNQTKDGRTLYGNMWLTYACAKKTVENLQKVFDWKGHNITEFNEPILYGKRCVVVTDTEEYNGVMKEKILFFNKLGGMTGIDSSELEDLVKDVQPFINEALGIKEDDNKDENVQGTNETTAKQEEDLPF